MPVETLTRWFTAEGRRTYVDTSAFIAFSDRSDSYHRKYAALFSDPPALLTTTAVIVEGHAWFLRRYDAHILGVEKPETRGKTPSRKLLRRSERIETLPKRKQEALMQTIDAF